LAVPAGWPAQPSRRKRGWLRGSLGVVAIVAGLSAVVLGITAVVGERQRIEDDAVARGIVGETVSFEAAEASHYTVYLILEGRIGDDLRDEAVVARTRCETSSGARFSGSRQGAAVTLGRASTVGRFDAPAGEIAVSCVGADGERYIVTPGNEWILRSILEIVGGAFALLAGAGLLIWGLAGRRVPA
jgi:hypothetical protein